jgi:hypothetical protein
MDNATHVFEQAGLGRAPFRFVGMENTAAAAGPDGLVRVTDPETGLDYLTQPGGSCDLCGHGIVNFCWIVDADGKRFKVGTECVNKTGDAGLKKTVKRAVAKARTAARKAREAKKIAACARALRSDETRAALAARPHPREAMANKGYTLENWADWMMHNAGNKGKLEVARIVAGIAA